MTNRKERNLYHPLYGEPIKDGHTVEMGSVGRYKVTFRAYQDRGRLVAPTAFRDGRFTPPPPVLIDDDHRIEVRFSPKGRYWTIVDKERIYALTSPDYETQAEAIQAGLEAQRIFDGKSRPKRTAGDDLRFGPSITLDQSLNEDQIGQMINALQSAARLWSEWADELAQQGVADLFRQQAEEANAIADGLNGAVGLIVLR